MSHQTVGEHHCSKPELSSQLSILKAVFSEDVENIIELFFFIDAIVFHNFLIHGSSLLLSHFVSFSSHDCELFSSSLYSYLLS